MDPQVSSTPEHAREPCPDRILDDLGGAFAMGAIGGGAFHFLRGLKNSPRGSRLLDAFQTARMNAPRTAGSFAVWGGIFSLADCSLTYLRQKEDPWNSIIAGAFTGGFLQMRQGFGSAYRSALMGGLLLALMEGFLIAQNRLATTPQQQIIYVDRNNMPIGMDIGGPFGMQIPNNNRAPEEATAASSSASSTTSSWFGGWFVGGGKKKETEKKSEAKTEVLESFDAPTPPTFEFK